MKYIFILNPAAGKNKAALSFIPKIQKAFKDNGGNYEIHISLSGDDITEYVKNLPDSESYRIYAFGGDGTLSNVVNGCVYRDNIEVGVFPMGTGNDFIKAFDVRKELFLDLEAQINGSSRPVDLIRYEDKYCINMCNMGFDARVAIDMPNFKKLPLVSNKAAYNLALAKHLTRKLSRYIEVTADGKPVFSGEAVFCCAGNGISAGGGYYMTPKAKVDDGLIDICIVRQPSYLKLLKFMKAIESGTHVEDPVTKDYVTYLKCTSFSVKARESLALVNDGDGEYITEMSFGVAPLAVKFIIPKR